MNLRKLGFHIWEAGLKVKGIEDKLELRRVLSRCPRILSPTCPLKDANVSLYVFGEDTETLRSVIESFKEFPNTEVVYMSHSNLTPYPEGFKVNLYPDKGNVTPCGRKCSECSSYQNNLCVGCPAVTEYKGPL